MFKNYIDEKIRQQMSRNTIHDKRPTMFEVENNTFSSKTSTPKKILIVADLDYTQFNTSRGTWIGGKDYWIDLYTKLSNKISASNRELVFAIVTKKSDFDTICKKAAKALRPFLEKQNPHMFRKVNNIEWCLVNHNENHVYKSLGFLFSSQDADSTLKDVVSHFEIMPFGEKSDAVKRLASFYGIPLVETIILDDKIKVLSDAKKYGIQTVSYECFGLNTELLDDDKYVSMNLKKAEIELNNIVDNILGLHVKNEIPLHVDDLEMGLPLVESNRDKNGTSCLSRLIEIGLTCFCLRRCSTDNVSDIQKTRGQGNMSFYIK